MDINEQLSIVENLTREEITHNNESCFHFSSVNLNLSKLINVRQIVE